MKNVLIAILALGIVACSSTREKNVKDQDISEDFQKDYIIRDAQSKTRPGWIVDSNDWAEKENLDLDKHRFFSFETEPKVSREMACNYAKANANAEVAGEITTFIKKSFGSSMEGQAAIDPNNPITQPMRNYMENSLVEKVQAIITGANVYKKHWEKRQYLKDRGAKRDYIGYTCAVMVRIERDILQAAIDQVRAEMMNKTTDSNLKNNVKNALNKAEEDFIKMRGI